MIKWGAQEDFSLQLGANFLHLVTPVSHGFYMACSNKNTYIFTKQNVIKTLYDTYSLLLYMKETDTVCGIKLGTESLCVFNPLQYNNFLLKDFKLGQTAITDVHYNPFTRSLLTIGNKIKVWNFNIIKNEVLSLPTVNITPRSTFAPQILKESHKLSFDDSMERIIISTHIGYNVYNYYGDLILSNTSYVGKPAVTVAFLHSTKRGYNENRSKKSKLNIFKRMATSTQNGEIYLWHKSGDLLRCFNSGCGAIYYLNFIDSEYILCANSSNLLSLIDMQTSKTFTLFNLPLNSELKQIEKEGNIVYLYVLSANVLTVYSINLLWRVWLHPIAMPSIARTISTRFSSRIVLMSKTGVFYLLTKDAANIGTIFSSRISIPTSYAYERSFDEEYVIIAYNDGSMEAFDFNGSEFQSKVFVKASTKHAFFVQAQTGDPWILCTVNMFSDLIFFDPKTLAQTRRVHVDKDPITKAFWEPYFHVIIIITAKKLFYFNLLTLRLSFICMFDKYDFMNYSEGCLYCLSTKGEMKIFKVSRESVELQNEIDFKKEVISFYCDFGLFVLSCIDNQIIIGSKSQGHILTMEASSQPYSTCFLNPNLDLLVATESEVMIIELASFSNKLEPLFLSIYDEEKNKIDPLVKKKVQFYNSRKTVTYNTREYREIETKNDEENIILNARLKMADETLYFIKKPKEDDETEKQKHSGRTRRIKSSQKKIEKTEEEVVERKPKNAVIRKTDPKDLIHKKIEEAENKFEFIFNEDGTCTIKEKGAVEEPKVQIIKKEPVFEELKFPELIRKDEKQSRRSSIASSRSRRSSSSHDNLINEIFSSNSIDPYKSRSSSRASIESTDSSENIINKSDSIIAFPKVQPVITQTFDHSLSQSPIVLQTLCSSNENTDSADNIEVHDAIHFEVHEPEENNTKEEEQKDEAALNVIEVHEPKPDKENEVHEPLESNKASILISEIKDEETVSLEKIRQRLEETYTPEEPVNKKKKSKRRVRKTSPENKRKSPPKSRVKQFPTSAAKKEMSKSQLAIEKVETILNNMRVSDITIRHNKKSKWHTRDVMAAPLSLSGTSTVPTKSTQLATNRPINIEQIKEIDEDYSKERTVKAPTPKWSGKGTNAAQKQVIKTIPKVHTRAFPAYSSSSSASSRSSVSQFLDEWCRSRYLITKQKMKVAFPELEPKINLKDLVNEE